MLHTLDFDLRDTKENITNDPEDGAPAIFQTLLVEGGVL